MSAADLHGALWMIDEPIPGLAIMSMAWSLDVKIGLEVSCQTEFRALSGHIAIAGAVPPRLIYQYFRRSIVAC